MGECKVSKGKKFPEEELHWKSAISRVRTGKILIRGYNLTDLIGRTTFSEMLWLVTMGELPSPEVARVMDAVLVSAMEAGAQSHCVLAARTVASCGAPVTTAMAAGALSISKYHGGAVEGAMRQWFAIRDEVQGGSASLGEACRLAVEARLARRERLEGFGSRVHKEIDPRAEKLFQITREAGFSGGYPDLALAVERALEAKTGKKLPLNIDGAYAAILCELGFRPELANALFLLSRSVGIMTHVYEEQARMRPRRYIHPIDWEYDGPGERSL
jgi:citrate synthase